MTMAVDLNDFHHDSAVDLLWELENTIGPALESLVTSCVHNLPELQEGLLNARCEPEAVERVIGKVEELAEKHGLSGFQSENEWGPVVPFNRTEGIPFPIQSFPDWLREFVEQEAEATQTPIDMGAMFGMAALATAVAGRFLIESKPGHFEPLNIYVMVAMPPASRKSSVIQDIAGPLYKFERAETDATAGERIASENSIKALNKRNDQLQKNAAKEDDPEKRNVLLGESEELALEIALKIKNTPAATRLIASDVTPERLAGLMCANGERMAIWSAEGGEVAEMMLGRYSANGRANIELYLKGHSGDPVIVDRQGTPKPIQMEHPCITMGLAVQPSVIQSLKGTRDRGILGRFLYSIPENTIGSRNVRSDPVPLKTARRYSDQIRCLLNTEGDRDPISLSDDARETWFKFSERIERGLAPYGEYEGITDWAGKLPGAVARIAGLLHCGELAGEAHPTSRPVSVNTMQRAVAIGKYLVDHALVAFSLLANGETDEAAQKLWRSITTLGKTEFRERELLQRVKGGIIDGKKEFQDAMANLESRGFVCKVEVPATTRRGRPRSQKWAVHPEALETHR